MTQDFRRRFEALQEQAEIDAARALVDLDEEPRPTRKRRTTLASMSDDEPDSTVTVNIVTQETKAAVAQPDVVQVPTPGGTISGKPWHIVAVSAALALLTLGVLLAWRLLTR